MQNGLRTSNLLIPIGIITNVKIFLFLFILCNITIHFSFCFPFIMLLSFSWFILICVFWSKFLFAEAVLCLCCYSWLYSRSVCNSVLEHLSQIAPALMHTLLISIVQPNERSINHTSGTVIFYLSRAISNKLKIVLLKVNNHMWL